MFQFVLNKKQYDRLLVDKFINNEYNIYIQCLSWYMNLYPFDV